MHETLSAHMLEGILKSNEDLARHNRKHFDELGVVAINFMSAPGAGKTTLLEASLTELSSKHSFTVLEGDMVGELDAQRLRRCNVDVFQICTGRSCHLDAQMVAKLMHGNKLHATDYLLIENVGNLVCPAEFPLGEHKRVVLLSVTEGDDKPLKYPVIFHNCDAVVFTKCDLLPFVDFDLERAQGYVNGLNPTAQCFAASTVSKKGLGDWFAWLQSLKRVKSENAVERSVYKNVSVRTG